MKLKHAIIISILTLTHGCIQSESNQTELALRKVVNKYPVYEGASENSLANYYTPSIIYNLKNADDIQLQLLTTPGKFKNENSIVLIKDANKKCFAIPNLSNKYDDFWQFDSVKSVSYNMEKTFEFEVKKALDSLSMQDSLKCILVMSLFQIMGYQPLFLLDTNMLMHYNWDANCPNGSAIPYYKFEKKKVESMQDCELRCRKICSDIISKISKKYSNGIDFRFLFFIGGGKIFEVSMKNAYSNTGKFEIKIIAHRIDCRIESAGI